MSGKSPAVQFYTSDFLVGTLLMSNEQRGAYITLLCLQHQMGRLSRGDVEKITTDPAVLEKFVVDEDGRYYNKRMEREAIKSKGYSESRRANRVGHKGDDDDEQPTHVSTHVEHVKNTCSENVSTCVSTCVEHMEDEKEKEKEDVNNSFSLGVDVKSFDVDVGVDVKGVDVGDTARVTDGGGAVAAAVSPKKRLLTTAQQVQFERFWAAYPKKVSKGQAMATWKKLNSDGTLTDAIIAGVERAKTGDNRFRDAEYIPHASTWLNSAGWMDEHSSVQTSGAAPGINMLKRLENILTEAKGEVGHG